jgi:hypothetical protein
MLPLTPLGEKELHDFLWYLFVWYFENLKGTKILRFRILTTYYLASL